MFKVWDSTAGSSRSILIQGSLDELWRENRRSGWATFFALILILVWHCRKRFYFRSLRSNPTTTGSASKSQPQFRNLEIVSDADLKFLIKNLDQNENEKWEHVIDKRNSFLSYSAKCCKPKDGPLKYVSVTVFENCSPEMLRDFNLDNAYRKHWDKTMIEHEQLQVDETSGVEIGRTIKKFPLLTPREYVLAWRLWKREDQVFYCFTKDCEHPSAPRQKKYVRVEFFRSGWRIRKVPGQNACEVKMFYQEDAGLNVEMAKLAFTKGIWNFVSKMDAALRKYSMSSHPRLSPAISAITLIQKIPPGLDTMEATESSTASAMTTKAKERKLSRGPSRKMLENSLLLLGGAFCLSRGHSSLGAKVAMAYILTKLSKRSAASDQSRESRACS